MREASAQGLSQRGGIARRDVRSLGEFRLEPIVAERRTKFPLCRFMSLPVRNPGRATDGSADTFRCPKQERTILMVGGRDGQRSERF